MENFIKKHGINILVSLFAGAAGAVLVLNSPQAASLVPGFTESLNQPNYVTEPGRVITDERENAIVSAVEKASPAVVSIVISKDVPVLEQYYEETPFDQFFGNNLWTPFQFRVPQMRKNGTEKREIGGGSGFIVSREGLVITNKHVVEEPDASYTVFTNDGEKHDAKVIAQDPVNDVAVLKIEGNNFPFLNFADSDQLKVGQTVIAIGNALSEFDNTVSVGVVSGLSRSIIAGSAYGASEQLDEVIQTDAAINPGNSGGPLLNIQGEVVGVNVAVAMGSENIGFALPGNLVSRSAREVAENGRIVRPYLGVRYVAITEQLKSDNNLPYNYGAVVTRGQNNSELAVIPGSPANKAGIVEGDIILEIDGQKLENETSLSNIIGKKSVGDQVTLKVWHQGNEKEVRVTLSEMPTQSNQ